METQLVLFYKFDKKLTVHSGFDFIVFIHSRKQSNFLRLLVTFQLHVREKK